jgi:hypothetical protein
MSTLLAAKAAAERQAQAADCAGRRFLPEPRSGTALAPGACWREVFNFDHSEVFVGGRKQPDVHALPEITPRCANPHGSFFCRRQQWVNASQRSGAALAFACR